MFLMAATFPEMELFDGDSGDSQSSHTVVCSCAGTFYEWCRDNDSRVDGRWPGSFEVHQSQHL